MTFRPRLVLAWATLFAAALGGCDRAEESLPGPPLEAARAALARGEPIAAEAALKRAMDSGTPRSAVAAMMGEAALARGDLDAAHGWLDGGDFDAVSKPLGLRLRGRLALAEGDIDLANRTYAAALADGAESAGLWVDIARLRYRGGDQVGALQAADRAGSIRPSDPDYLLLRGQLLRDAHGPARALAFYREGGASKDGSLGRDYAATLGDSGEASAALTAIASDGSPRSNFLRAVIAARGGNFVLAQRFLQQSDTGNRDTPAGRLLGAIIDLEQGNSATAEAALSNLAAEQPDNRLVQELWAAATARARGPRAVIERFAQPAAAPNGSAYLRTIVARAYEAADDRVSAARFIDLAALGSRSIAPMPATEGEGPGNELRGGDPAAARQFVARFPGSADAQALLGDALARSGDKSGARAAYARSARVRQSWPLLLRRLAVAATPAEASSLVKAYFEGHPTSGEAAFLLADAAARSGDWQLAAKLLDHALANGMDRVPSVIAARAVAALNLGDREEALAWALSAHALQPMNRQAIAAVIAALPAAEAAARGEFQDKLARLPVS